MKCLAVVVIALAVGCGGSSPGTSKAPPLAAASPAAACLTLAGTARERKAGEPEKISVKHVLVKYAGAKNAVASVTRTREEACLRALQARDAVRGGADFDLVVKDYSDEAGAVSRGGSLGAVERKTLVPAFADAAFELASGELSDVVESPFGFHVIFRTE